MGGALGAARQERCAPGPLPRGLRESSAWRSARRAATSRRCGDVAIGPGRSG